MKNNKVLAKSIWDIWKLPKHYPETAEQEETIIVQELPLSSEDSEAEWDRHQDDFPKGEPWTDESEDPSSYRRLAWYLPYVFHGQRGGIYITIHGLISISHQIRRELLTTGQTHQAAEISLRCAWEFLFLHELYHHRTEMFALSYDASENKTGTYENWHLNLKYPKSNVGAHLEPLDESLSNAYGFRGLTGKQFFKSLPKRMRTAVSGSLLEMFANSPAGYRDAKHLIGDNSFPDAERELVRRMLQKTVTPVQPIRTDVLFGLRFSLSRLRRPDVRIVLDTKATPIELAEIQRMTQGWGGNKIIKMPFMRISPKH